MKNTLLALAVAAGLSLPAHAVMLESATLNGNLLDTSFSTPSLIALDVSLLNNAALSFSFVLDAADVAAGGADFNAILRDVSGFGIGSLNVTTGGASVSWTAGSVRAATLNGDLLDTDFFTGATVTELYFGNPFYEEGLSDWRVGFAGLSAGDRFTLDIATTPAVPEPREWMMMLGGLGMIVLSAARKLGR
ncbi:hypothetical protein [Methyloversatilis discipulorum]|uniref:hypothetical protein n=1 Tax=Methyloversatilis discipulorum TaxID=1119528 RepID=UPI001A46C059|nr:hypothetical protein [Methyloversatilis discipulorum]MBL8468458.1 hypothetical protein [Methyloversatilis discipulorum]